MDKYGLFANGLQMPPAAIAYNISQQLRAVAGERHILATRNSFFRLESFAEDQQCTVAHRAGFHTQTETGWYGGGEFWRRAVNGWFDVQWGEYRLEVVMCSWDVGYDHTKWWWIIGDKAVAEAFMDAVCEWHNELRQEILVFSGGCWRKSHELWEAIQLADVNQLVLKGTLKDDIVSDIDAFFESRPIYQEHDVPWKRGILFVGPPGNGKTHFIKGLARHLGVATLYVRSFKSGNDSEQSNMEFVFERARGSAPSLLVMEDLDSMINDGNRSFFLNELDGLENNDGLVVLATTNHPDKLDPAIVERPSRFDMKYAFDLPGMKERIGYFGLWNTRLKPEMRIPESVHASLAERTSGFSFAYLKELYLSSMMVWIRDRTPGAMGDVLEGQIPKLRAQMSTK